MLLYLNLGSPMRHYPKLFTHCNK